MAKPTQHHRRSIRLKGYDYAQPGAYYVTIVTQGRECLFGDVVDGEMRLNRAGQVAQREWERLPRRFPHIQLDAFVIMPNHVHGIIIITTDDDARGRGTAGLFTAMAPSGPAVPLREPTAAAASQPEPTAAPQHEQFGKPVPGSIPTIVRSYKSAATLRINYVRGVSGAPVWQRNYYEHIVRDENALNRIRQYVANNPTQWDDDEENPGKAAR